MVILIKGLNFIRMCLYSDVGNIFKCKMLMHYFQHAPVEEDLNNISCRDFI